MKAKMLKIAGVKTEKAFYKKYPTEAAFFKAHPEAKELVKAQVGAYIGGETSVNPTMVNFQDYYDEADKMITGSTAEERQKAAEAAAMAKGNSGGGGGMDMSNIMSMAGQAKDLFGKKGAKYGTYISKAQFGEELEGTLSGTPGFVEGLGMDNINGYNVDNSGNVMDGSATTGYKATKTPFDFTQGIPLVGNMLGAFNAFDAEKKAKKQAQQMQRLSEVTLAASRTRPEQSKRRYVTPWDNPVQPGQMFPVNGVGTNVLAEDGAEIQNTFAPGTLYDDLGYEPLNDSDQVKQYYHGGGIPRAQFGLESLGGFGLASAGGAGFGSNPLGNIAGGFFDNNAGSQMGGAVGSVFGPIGGAAGSFIGGALDQAFGDSGKAAKARKQAERNMKEMAMNNMGPAIQAGFASHLKEGGYLSHDYNPQVIAEFGGLDEQDFYDYAHDGMDSLRSGGHLKGEYTPVSPRGLQTYAMGGELKTHWGGHAETMSHNPFLPGGGETVMFRGQSHDESDGRGNTGIGITYGNSPVEVERGEPAVKLKDGGTNEENLTVYGNLQIPNEYVPLLGDSKAKGKKFKNYVAQISKDEARHNKTIEKSTNMLNDLAVKTPFDKLKFDALTANINGANMKLKDIADKKINAAHLQNAINDTAEEYGLVAADLAKGKAKVNKDAMQEYAEYGKTIPNAQKGKVIKGRGKKWDYTEIGPDQSNPEWQSRDAYYRDWTPKVDKALNDPIRGSRILKFIKSYQGPNASKVREALNQLPTEKEQLEYLRTHAKDEDISDMHYLLDAGIKSTEVTPKPVEDKKVDTPKKEEEKRYETTDYKRSKWMDIANQILPFIRPTDQEPLDPNQLMGEMYALSNNQVDPVQAQGFQPDLGTPYDISYQDMLNANQADYNATQRMSGYNPAALSQLNAQKYAANEKVLGEQFRQNQAMKAGVYDKNRDILNSAKLKNIDIFDQQYGRQSQAVSNSKAIAQAALNSISDKYAKNKAANRELGIYENLYNYRYDPSGRAINMNPFMQPNLPTMYGKQTDPNYVPVKDANGNIIEYKAVIPESATKYKEDAASPTSVVPDYEPVTQQTTEEEDMFGPLPLRNGGKTKKDYRNGSIVKFYKNI